VVSRTCRVAGGDGAIGCSQFSSFQSQSAPPTSTVYGCGRSCVSDMNISWLPSDAEHLRPFAGERPDFNVAAMPYEELEAKVQ